MLIYEVRHPDDASRTVKYQVRATQQSKQQDKGRRNSVKAMRQNRSFHGAFLGLKPASATPKNQDKTAQAINSQDSGNLAELVSSFYKTVNDDSNVNYVHKEADSSLYFI